MREYRREYVCETTCVVKIRAYTSCAWHTADCTMLVDIVRLSNISISFGLYLDGLLFLLAHGMLYQVARRKDREPGTFSC